MSGNNTIYIIVPVFNRKNITIEYVNCLKRQTFTNYKLIIIDNGCDGTGKAVKELLINSIIIEGNKDLWWADSLQIGLNYIKSISRASDSIIHINNDDTSFSSEFLERGIKALLQSKKSLVCATARSNLDQDKVDTGVSINWSQLNFNKYEEGRELNCTSTRGLFFRLNDFIALGEFIPKLLPHYLSDYEFTARAYQKGYKLIVPKDLELTYFEDETGDREVKPLGILKIFPHMFSKRNAMNPYVFLKFVLIRSPWKYKLKNVIQISWKFMRYVARAILVSLNLYKKIV